MFKNTHINKIKALTLFGVFTITACLGLQVAGQGTASAYTHGRLIDDALFLDARSMSVADIQNFLNTKSGTMKSRTFLLDCDIAGGTAKQMYLSAGAPCGQTVSVATILYYSSQVYGMNPKVIMSTLQKEQSLVTNPNPTDRAYAQAMGYNCPDSGGCASNSSFFYQIDNGTWGLRYHRERANGNNTWWNSRAWVCGTTKNYYAPNLYPNQDVRFYDDNAVLYATVYINNPATSSLYCYTPHAYNNPQGLYGRSAYGTTGMYYSGSYNFVYYYELWFGSTFATNYNGLDYAAVFDAEYYLNKYPDLKSAFGIDYVAAFRHFVTTGINEGRQGNAGFNVTSYKNRYPDLRVQFGKNLSLYYQHYLLSGRGEGRVATGDIALTPITSFGGKDYSTVYNYGTYMAQNSDLRAVYSDDDAGAINHFVSYGMNEGRAAETSFNVSSYMNRYEDLRRVFGNNLKAYYLHYNNGGKNEGRVATGTYYGGTTIYRGVDYSPVYEFNTYTTSHSDIRRVYGLDDQAALEHFVALGMAEGRQAKSSFSVQTYKARYPDLQQAFGNDLKAYYLHYLQSGRKEGRTAN